MVTALSKHANAYADPIRDLLIDSSVLHRVEAAFIAPTPHAVRSMRRYFYWCFFRMPAK